MRRTITTTSLTLLLPLALTAREGQMNAAGKNLYLLENKGQITDQYRQPRNDIRFHLSGGAVNVFVGNGSLHYQFNETLRKEQEAGDKAAEHVQVKTYRMDVVLQNANKNALVITEDKLSYTEHYYLSDNHPQGVTAASYRKITYRDIYPHIDWVLRLNADGKLEYDFVVRPGGKVSDIRIRYEGASSLRVNKDGTLTAATPMGSITEQAPFSYTAADNRKVASAFVLNDNTLSFRTAPHQGTLVIDPTLDWATYYGGSSEDDNGDGRYEAASDVVATDAACNVYLGGRTGSANNIATTGAHQSNIIGILNGFVVKFDKQGVRQWATYYPGAYSGPFITCDKWGYVYLAGGTTISGGISTPGSHQPVRAGGYDAFLIKFNSTGVRQWATFYGGTERDIAYSVRCDVSGNVFLAGYTEGSTSGIATPGSHQASFGGGASDAWVVKFDSAGVRQWGSYYGGSDEEKGHSVSCDAAGNVYLTGNTASTSGIATPGSHQASYTNNNDAFLVKFNSAGVRQWGTYYGGNNLDRGQSVGTDAQGNVYLGGWTESTNGIATPGSHQPAHGGGSYDAFVVKFSSAGARQWATYCGGSDMDQSFSMKTDPAGNVYLSGYTYSTNNISTVGSHQPTHAGVPYNFDGFLVKFNSAGVRQYGTYYGGPESDYVISVHTDISGGIYLAGYTDGSTSGIATANGHQTAYGGGLNDYFLARFSDCEQLSTSITAATPLKFCQGDSVILRTGGSSVFSCIDYQWKRDGNNISGATDSFYVAKIPGVYSLVLSNGSCNYTTDPDTVKVNPLPSPIITATGLVLRTDSFSTYQWYLNGNPVGGATGRSHTAQQNGAYTVKVTDTNGCSNTSAIYNMTTVSVTETEAIAKAIRVYPNPFSNVVHIQSPVTVNITLLNLVGQAVLQQQAARETDLSHLPAGTYLMRISDEQNRLLRVEKLVKTEPAK